MSPVHYQSRPETPILDNLEFKGGRHPKHLLDKAVRSALMEERAQVLMVLGAPGSGKSTLISEMLAYLCYQLEQQGFSEREVIDRLFYLGFEDAMRLANRAGWQREEDENSTVTHVFYYQSELEFQARIGRHLRPGAIVIVEAPGMIGRGSLTSTSLGRRRGSFAKTPYEVCFVFITADETVMDTSRYNRFRYRERPDSKIEVLEESGVRVLADEEREPHITGGDSTAVERYFESERRYLWDLYKRSYESMTFTHRISSEAAFDEPLIRAQFLEEVFVPGYFQERLRTTHERSFIGRNSKVEGAILYQRELDLFNAIRRELEASQ